MSPIRFRSTGRDTVAKKQKQKKEREQYGGGECVSVTHFVWYSCLCICVHTDSPRLLPSTYTVMSDPNWKHMYSTFRKAYVCVAHISPPLGQNRNWSISDSHLESGDYILLGIVSRRRHRQPCYQCWGIIKQHFCPLSSSRGEF